MSALKEWIIAGWIHLAVGIFIGWVIFKRPQWAQNLIDKVKAKLKSL